MKQEWPHNWTTFISDIVGASKTSESLCTNNMAILKLLRFVPYIIHVHGAVTLCTCIFMSDWQTLHGFPVDTCTFMYMYTHTHTSMPIHSEEVFEFSSGQMTQVKSKHLKDTMCNEFSQIFQLCSYVLVGICNVHTFYTRHKDTCS